MSRHNRPAGLASLPAATGFALSNNDVVNPDARDNPQSPIAGMPILEVDRAHSVIVLKRGKGKGFAGIENPLFFKPNTGMLYGDAKSSLTKLVQAVQEV
jgi:H+-translocating NAD(P) transhydrogenase subunit beta